MDLYDEMSMSGHFNQCLLSLLWFQHELFIFIILSISGQISVNLGFVNLNLKINVHTFQIFKDGLKYLQIFANI